MIHYTTFDTPIGPLGLARTERGLARILFEAEIPFLAEIVHRKFPYELLVENAAVLEPTVKQLQEYFHGERTVFELETDLVAPQFYKSVLLEVAKIPYGKTASYKEIASRVGNPGAVRAVGGANAHNPLPIIIPCHRVLAHNRGLGGYGGGLELKQYLLELEGIL
ncbi:MAG: methylated-DNA--[protein]-cysteine S-methyltransferase [Fidelibacterota bacterium]